MKLEFSQYIFRDTQIPNFMKICPVGAEMIHADGQTDIINPIVAFRNFANTPKKLVTLLVWCSQEAGQLRTG